MCTGVSTRYPNPRVGESYGSPRAELLAGGLAGLLPVVAIALWGWYMTVR